MKHLTLTPILLPTEDANSTLYFNPEKELCIGKHIIISGKEHPKQHIYLCSTESESSKAGEWNYDQTIKCVVNDMAHSDCFKILFTTDPLLIKDGVPSLDGSTKALIENLDKLKVPEALNYNMPDFIQVPFLTEFCDRWSRRGDLKGADAGITEKDFVKALNSKINFNYLKDGLDKEAAEVCYQLALKMVAFRSGSGVYSLDDIEKAIEWGINVEAGNISRDYSIGAGRQFIGSLSKSEPKEGIVIELNDGNLVFKH